jgi:predicted DNA-binding transcriptional regulator AlpA
MLKPQTMAAVMQEVESPSDLLTTADVAARTRAPEATVRYWRHIGYGPQGFRVGRRVVYQRSEVERWLSELAQVSA